MAERDDAETLLDRRLTLLGLAKTQVAIDATATMRPWPSQGPPTRRAPPPEQDGLPKISVDERPEALEPSLDARTSRADYALVSTLGEGGMGRVHLAHQRSLERDVAVKTLKPDAPPAVRSALVREARLTGSLEHPGVIPVHAFGVDDSGRPLLVMKRVDGVDFATMLADHAHPSWRARGVGSDVLVAGLEILIQVCQTLEFAHQRGVVHRDIKPENIMVGSFGEVYLLDWGVAAKMDEPVDPQSLVGTPAYMAPEMVLGEKIDARTDVYLLGATLHELLTGRARHDGEHVVQVLRSAVLSAPVAYGAAVPEQLARSCNRATSRDPEARPESAAAFRAELSDFLRHRGARALAEAAGQRVDSLVASFEGDAPPADLTAAYRLASEARFGFSQALSEHPGNPIARAGLRRCLEASIELELRQGHAQAAIALLRDLDPPAPELEARAESMRKAMADREAEDARLRGMQRELDPAQSAAKRGIALIGLTVFVVVIGSAAAMLGRQPNAFDVVVLAAAGFAVVAVGAWVLRRRILINVFNRRASGLLVFAVGAMLANRLLGMWLHTAVASTLINDLLLYIVAFAAAGILLMPGLWMGVVPLALGIGATLLWPSLSSPIFSVTIIFALLAASRPLARSLARANQDAPK